MARKLELKVENRGKSRLIDREDYLVSIMNEESDSLNASLSIIKEISAKYDIDFNQIVDLLKNKDKYVCVPVGLFRSKLGPLEAIVRYLKDVLDYNLVNIAKLLCRDETTIWTTYHNATSKGNIIVDFEMKDIDFKKFKVKKDELLIPVSLFAERRLSVLESMSVYMKETFGLSYHHIGQILGRNDRTIWTVVNRAKKKLEAIE